MSKVKICFLLSVFGVFFLIADADAADLYLNSPLESGYYGSDENIIAQEGCEIPPGENVWFIAQNSITLEAGFRAESGSTFRATIGDAQLDSDGDGLPDFWEIAYFYGLGEAGNDDYDADGYTNFEEYNLSTNPDDETSVPDPDGYDEGIDYGLAENAQQGGDGIVGETVSILNGNMIESRSDLLFGSPHSMGLRFNAHYNSRSGRLGDLGHGWSHTYSAALESDFGPHSGDFIRIVDETGRMRYFLEAAQDVFEGFFNERTEVRVESGEFIWYRLDGRKYGFSGTGRLIWIDDEKENRISLSYDVQNRLETVTDSASGRVLTLYYAAGLLDHIIGPSTTAVSDGVWVNYGYNGNQNLTSVTYADGSGFTYSYTDSNDVHNLTEKRNKANHLINTWSYDNLDRCYDNFSSQGNGVAVNYVSGIQVDVTDEYGTMRTYTIGEIQGNKRVVAMSTPASPPYNESSIIRWDYDTDVNLTEVETAAGRIHQYQNHDSRGNPQTIILASGAPEQRTITYTYHPEINVPLSRTEASVLGAGNKVTTWDFDDDYDLIPNENPTKLISRFVEKGFTKDASGATVSYEYVTIFTYNSKGQVLSIDGPLAGTADITSFAYEGTTGNLQSVTQPLIGATSFSNYDAAGQLGQVTDVNGQSETFDYDGRGRVTEVTHEADSNSRSVIYNNAGLPEMVTDEDGVYHTFEYDAAYGRLVRKNDMDGNYIAYAYDAQGNLIERSRHNLADEMYSRTRWNYQHPDIAGRLWKIIKYNDSFAEYDYDDDGNVNTVTDFNSNPTAYEYDPLNRLITVTQPGTVVTSYDYDLHGNLVSVLDAESHETTYIYDDMGRAVSTTSPDSGAANYVYDAAGNLKQKTDAKATTVQYLYDNLNRLTDVKFPDSTQDIGYSYDAGTYGKSRRTGMTDPSGSTDFDYNSRGRLVSKDSTVNAVPYLISRSFTPGGRVESFTYPSGRTVNFERYDDPQELDYMKLKKLTTTKNSITITLIDNLGYTPFGPPSDLQVGPVAAVANQTGPCGCLESTNIGQQMEQIYAYDNNDNLTGIQAANSPWLDQTLTYDPLNRLKTAQGSYGSIVYNYDKVGNRKDRNIDGLVDYYEYQPGTNRLDYITGANPATFAYDANGNITGNGSRAFIYSQGNRLARVEEGGNTVAEYTYNGLGQRIIKDINATATIFHYDFDGNIIGESDSGGTFAQEYIYMGGNQIAMFDDDVSRYHYLNNYLGTPILLTDFQGNVVWEAEYKPFGEADVNSSSTVVNNFRFSGQYYDDETGLHYNYHRYYDPRTGRYLTPDPIGLAGGINLYAYVENNPINDVDPLGLHGIVLMGRGPWYVNLPRHIRAPYRYIKPRGLSKQQTPKQRYVPEPAPNPIKLSKWARFWKDFADWLGEIGLGGIGGAAVQPFSDTQDRCNIDSDTPVLQTKEDWDECYRLGNCL